MRSRFDSGSDGGRRGERRSARPGRQPRAGFVAELEKRILVLDGAMGTQIQSLGLSESDFRGERFAGHRCELAGDNEILSLTRPELVRAIHEAYLEAGADIITTNTFNATAVSQAPYGTGEFVYEMNLAASRIASQAAAEFTARDPARPRFVAGSMGPTGKSCSLPCDPDDPSLRAVSFDQLSRAYAEQAEALLDGGVDVFLVETVYDTLNAKAALFAIREVLERRGMGIPVWISATVSDRTGRLLAGQTLEAFWISVSHADPLLVGLNCGFGPEELRPHLATLSRVAGCYVSVHPNAGLPDETGRYAESPGAMASAMERIAAQGLVNVVGGCCGTSPEHIAAIAEAVRSAAPRVPAGPSPRSRFSGLEPLEIGAGSLFVNIGERTNVTGSARFARLMREGRREEAVEVAREQIRAGAQMIDVNVDDPMLDSPREMQVFLKLIGADPEVAKVPVMIDSARWEVMEEGLKCLQGKGIVNSISLKDGEDEFLRRARRIRDYGAAVVVMAFDEEGPAETYRRKVEVCTRAYTLLTQRAGFSPSDIVLDPAVFAVGASLVARDTSAVDFIEACRSLKATLPGCLVCGGVSNLSFAFRGAARLREAMHSVFLYHAVRAGMDMGIVNAGRLPVYEEIPEEVRKPVEDLVLARGSEALKLVTEIAKRGVGEPESSRPAGEESWRRRPVEERIHHAFVNGLTEHIREDVLEAAEVLGGSLEVIEGPLMSAMERVGELFGAGKMFLPQVIRSARVMKAAIAALEPGMQKESPGDGGDRRSGRRGPAKVLLATVKGDVHDIGKRIVATVLECNGYEVLDLGTSVPAQGIVEAAREMGADVIGLSGLITPSLDEMRRVAEELSRAGLRAPVLIGGAATSPAHTALKIDPAYEGAVIHVRDASRAVAAVRVVVGADPEEVERIKERSSRLRREVARDKRGAAILTIAEARRRKPSFAWESYVPPPPRKPGITVFEEYPIQDLVELIDWEGLLRVWRLRRSGQRAEENAEAKAEAQQVVSDARELLSRMVEEEMLSARAVVGIFAANSVGDDVEIYSGGDRERPAAVLYCLRQQRDMGAARRNLCLADFVAPKHSGIEDYVGAFVASAGFGCGDAARRFEEAGDDYSAIVTRALADALVEALAERLHRLVAWDIWGYGRAAGVGPGGQGEGRAGGRGRSSPAAADPAETVRGIRPAPGYPPCPDHSAKSTVFDILGAEDRIGVSLTETYAMRPAASVAGWYFVHPRAKYFAVGEIGRDQLADYARRKGVSAEEALRWLAGCRVGPE